MDAGREQRGTGAPTRCDGVARGIDGVRGAVAPIWIQTGKEGEERGVGGVGWTDLGHGEWGL